MGIISYSYVGLHNCFVPDGYEGGVQMMVDYFHNGKYFPLIFGFLFFCIILFFYLKEKIIQCVRKKYDCTREQSFVILSRSEGKSSRFLINLFFFTRIAATSSYTLIIIFVIFAAIYWHFRISDLTAS